MPVTLSDFYAAPSSQERFHITIVVSAPQSDALKKGGHASDSTANQRAIVNPDRYVPKATINRLLGANSMAPPIENTADRPANIATRMSMLGEYQDAVHISEIIFSGGHRASTSDTATIPNNNARNQPITASGPTNIHANDRLRRITSL